MRGARGEPRPGGDVRDEVGQDESDGGVVDEKQKKNPKNLTAGARTEIQHAPVARVSVTAAAAAAAAAAFQHAQHGIRGQGRGTLTLHERETARPLRRQGFLAEVFQEVGDAGVSARVSTIDPKAEKHGGCARKVGMCYKSKSQISNKCHRWPERMMGLKRSRKLVRGSMWVACVVSVIMSFRQVSAGRRGMINLDTLGQVP
nr:hypothetical protein CFP56_69343 [Quercus suber]